MGDYNRSERAALENWQAIEMLGMAKKKRASRKGTKNFAGKPYQVFVSHATADKWLARTVCEKIEETGASTFRDDRDINGGDDIPEEIRRQIKQSREIIVLLTPDSVDRQWVILEVGAAWGWSKRMRIIILMNHVSVDPIPDMIKNKKAITLNNFEHYLSELAQRVRG
jgi:predicted nucleotide-binding protein